MPGELIVVHNFFEELKAKVGKQQVERHEPWARSQAQPDGVIACPWVQSRGPFRGIRSSLIEAWYTKAAMITAFFINSSIGSVSR